MKVFEIQENIYLFLQKNNRIISGNKCAEKYKKRV